MAQAPTQDFIVKSGLNVQGTSTVTSSTGNTSTLQVDGGAAIAKNLIVGDDAVIYGDLTIQGIVPYITVTTGTFTSLTVIGLSTLNATTLGVTTATQLTVNSRLAVGGLSELNNVTIANQTNAASSTSGALQVSGGVGIQKDLWVGGRAFVNGYEVLTTATILASTLQQVTEQGSSTTVAISILNTTNSTGTNTGALIVAGGVGIVGDTHIGGKVYIGNENDSYPNLTTATSGLYAARSINLIDASAVIKVSRVHNTNAPAIELQAVNTSGIVRSYWDIAVSTAAGGVDDNIGFRWRTTNLSSSGGADRLLLYGTGTALVVIPMTTATNSTATGALVVKGGIGVGGGMYIGGIVAITNTTSATSTTTGALIVAGGVGIGGALYVNEFYANTASYINNSLVLTTATVDLYASKTIIIAGTDTSVNTSSGIVTVWNTSTLQTVTDRGAATSNSVLITNNTSATSTATGALQVRGGVGIGQDLWVGGTIYGSLIGAGSISTATNLANGSAGQVPYQTAPGVTSFYGPGVAGNVLVSNGTNAPSYNNTLTLTSTLSNTTTVAGNALQVAGGVGISNDLYVGGTSVLARVQTTNLVTSNTLSVTGTSTLSVLNATSGTFSGTLGVTGTSVLNGLQASNIVASGTLGVTGTSTLGVVNATSATFSGTLGVTGTSTLGVVNATSATFSGTLGVTGTSTLGVVNATSATFSGTLGVTGTSTLGVVNATSATFSGTLSVTGTSILAGLTTVTNTTAATSTSTGALQVRGGVGIGGALYVQQTSYINGSQILTTATIGNFAVGSITAGTDTAVSSSVGAVVVWNTSTLQTITNRGSTTTNAVNITNTTVSTSTATGALTVAGGVGVGGDLRVGGTIYGVASITGSISTATNIANGTAGQVPYQTAPGVTSFYGPGTAGDVLVSNGTNAPSYNNTLTLTSTLSNTTTVAGNALQVVGGVGINGSLFVHGPAYFVNNVVFSGTSTSVLSTTTVYTDNYIELHFPTGGGAAGVWSVDDGKDIGHIYHHYKDTTGDEHGALIWHNVSDELRWYMGGVNLNTATQVWDVSTATFGVFRTGSILLQNTTAATSTTTGTLVVVGGVGIGGGIFVGGISTFTNVINATSATFSGTLGVTGTSTLGVVNATSATFSGTLGVTGTSTLGVVNATSATFSGTLGVTGTTTLRVLNATSATFSGTLGVTGTSTLGVLNATSATFSGTLGVTGTSTLGVLNATSATFSGTLGVTGTSTLGVLNATSATFSGTLGVTGTSTLGVLNATSATFSGVSTVTNETSATSTNSGALQVIGGVGIGGALYVQQTSYINGAQILTTATIGNFGVSAITAGTDTQVSTSTGIVVVWNTSTLQSVTNRGTTTTNAISITNTTTSISTTTGALQVRGGVGVGGSVYVGNRVGFVNTSNVSRVYQYYNAATDSLDTVFG